MKCVFSRIFQGDFPGACMTLVGTLFDQKLGNDLGSCGRQDRPASPGLARSRSPSQLGALRRTENIRDVGGFWQSCFMKTYKILMKHETWIKSRNVDSNSVNFQPPIGNSNVEVTAFISLLYLDAWKRCRWRALDHGIHGSDGCNDEGKSGLKVEQTGAFIARLIENIREQRRLWALPKW